MIDGSLRQMMVAARELNIERLPESGRNWINTKLIYTHGYGVTMNPVNGFTSEGLPTLVLSDMPVQSTIPSLKVTRPEIYFGQLTNSDVYVKTRQKEFNYPQGEANNLTSYEGTGGIVLGGFFRRLLIALDRGDITKLPFSDDITPDSRLLMRRNIVDRIDELTGGFLTLDPDPYIVVGDDGRLSWIADGFTTVGHISVRAALGDRTRTDQLHPQQRQGRRRRLRRHDHVLRVRPRRPDHRGLPRDFSDAVQGRERDAAVPAQPRPLPGTAAEGAGGGLRPVSHGLARGVLQPRGFVDGGESGQHQSDQREQASQPMEPNFVLMTLPGETTPEFIEILPFTPANRNNLIGWIAARSDQPHYGAAIVYDFPKTRLVDGPLQIEARIDQNPQLSAQLSLWNQQGSRVLRGALIVIPIGRALLYAEPIYLQAEHSPMPQLRLVVLAIQDRLAYGPTLEEAMAQPLRQGRVHAYPARCRRASAAWRTPRPAPGAPAAGPGGARPQRPHRRGGRNFSDYQRLTAEGKLAEAGQKLEALKRTLEQLARAGETVENARMQNARMRNAEYT